MAHHHNAHDQSQSRDQLVFKVQSASPAIQSEPRSSNEVARPKQNAPVTSKAKTWLDFEIAGFPWQFVLVAAVIAFGVLGLLLKTLGVY